MTGMAMLAAATEINYFRVLFIEGGLIGWVLWLINFVTWVLIIKFLIDIRRETIMPELTRGQIEELFEAKQYRDVLEVTDGDPSFLAFVVHSSLSQANYGYAAMERSMEEAAEERSVKMLRNIEWLNLIGNIGPMLGLMGTVWGMILAFNQIKAVGGTPKPDQLAGSIGIALVTTLLGLIVAVPALSGYAVLRNRIDSMCSEALVMSQDFISTFRPAPKRG